VTNKRFYRLEGVAVNYQELMVSIAIGPVIIAISRTA
jgi:hypothetical protein